VAFSVNRLYFEGLLNLTRNQNSKVLFGRAPCPSAPKAQGWGRAVAARSVLGLPKIVSTAQAVNSFLGHPNRSSDNGSIPHASCSDFLGLHCHFARGIGSMRPKGAVAFVEPVNFYRLSGRKICFGETRRQP